MQTSIEAENIARDCRAGKPAKAVKKSSPGVNYARGDIVFVVLMLPFISC